MSLQILMDVKLFSIVKDKCIPIVDESLIIKFKLTNICTYFRYAFSQFIFHIPTIGQCSKSEATCSVLNSQIKHCVFVSDQNLFRGKGIFNFLRLIEN